MHILQPRWSAGSSRYGNGSKKIQELGTALMSLVGQLGGALAETVQIQLKKSLPVTLPRS